jgi:hypothetical protein
MMQLLSPCGIAVPRATFESMQVQQFSKGAEVTSVRAGYRQVIDVLAIVVENGFRPITADQSDALSSGREI